MWTVINRTKKARPGLAVVALGLILLASLLFAYWVERTKIRFIELKLDAMFNLSTNAGRISLKIPSAWQRVETYSVPDSSAATWVIPADSQNRQAAGLFSLDLMPSQILPAMQVIKFSQRNSWMGSADFSSLQMNMNPDSTLSFPHFDIQVFTDGGGKILTFRTIYLPDGMSLMICFLTPARGTTDPQAWLTPIANTLTFKPTAGLQQMPAGGTLDIKSLTFRLPSEMWVKTETKINALSIQPVTTDVDELWRGQIRFLHLPPYRNPTELLEDHFTDPFGPPNPIDMTPPVKIGTMTLYQATQKEVSKRKDARLQLVQTAFLLHSPDGRAIFATAQSSEETQKHVANFLNDLLTGAKQKSPTDRKPEPTDLRKIISVDTLIQQSEKVIGWFTIKNETSTIGFQAFAVVPRSDHKTSPMETISLTYLNTDYLNYHENEKSRIVGNLDEGGYQSLVTARIHIGDDIVNRSLIRQNRFTSDYIRLTVQINNDSQSMQVKRPVEFLPNGASAFFLALLAGQDWKGPAQIQIAQSADYRPHLQASEVQRLIGPDKIPQILIINDFSNEYSTHIFDSRGQWLGFTSTSGVSMRRTDAAQIQRLFPQPFNRTLQTLRELAEESQRK